MVELAFTLPIVIGLVFLCYWAFMAVSMRDSIYTAVYNSVDLAVSRGNAHKLGVATLSEVEGSSAAGLLLSLDALANTGAWGSALGSSGSPGLLTNGEISGSPQTAYTNFMNSTGRFSGLSFTDIPRETFYAMAFAYAELAPLLPGDLRYPCDPTQEENSACLICIPATGIHYGQSGTLAAIPADTFGLECHYRPSGALLQAAANIFDVDISSLVISHGRVHFYGQMDSF